MSCRRIDPEAAPPTAGATRRRWSPREALLTLLLAANAASAGTTSAPLPPDAKAARAEARRAFAASDLSRAGELARAYLSHSPDDVQMTSLAGLVEFNLGIERKRAGADREAVLARFTAARAHLERAEALLDGNAPPFVLHPLGYILYYQGELVGARRRFDAALAVNPSLHRGYRLRAQCNLRLGDADAGLADLARALEAEPSDLDLHLSYAALLSSRGRELDAAAALRSFYQRIRDRPAREDLHWKVLLQLTHHALRGFALADARAALVEARRILPDHPEPRHSLGVVLYRLGELEQARIELDGALASAALRPSMRAEALTRRGLIAKHRGDFAGARRDLEEAVRLVPYKAEAQQNLGAVLLRLGHRDQAERVLAEFRRALTAERRLDELRERLRRRPFAPKRFLELIDALLELGDVDAAGEVLDELRERLPDAPAAATAAARIRAAAR